MPDTFLPAREADLLIWSNNFQSLLATNATSYGLLAAQATAFTAINATWVTAYNAAVAPGTNSHASKVAKNAAKEALIDGPGGIRALAREIQGNPNITDEQLAELGLTVRDVEPSPIPVPAVAPTLNVVSVTGRQVKIRMRDAENPDRRGKPDGVDGATILTFVGADAPANPAEWSFHSNTSKPVVDIDFPASVAVGAKVWITCFWFNPRKQSSPMSAPQSTHIGAGMAMAA